MGKQTKLFSYNLLISIFFPSSIADKGKESKHMLKIELFNPNCLGGGMDTVLVMTNTKYVNMAKIAPPLQ